MKQNNSLPNEQYDEDILVETIQDKGKKLILYNDDVNTFDFVIETLVKVCNHEVIQAEQCAVIVHFKGKCIVKQGSFSKLEPLCTVLLDRGLTANIEE